MYPRMRTELTRVRKIIAKDRRDNGKPLQRPIGDLTKTLKEGLVISILIDAHFPGARITSGLEMEPKALKSSTNCIDWKKVERCEG